jgi:GNAT superfamily N-acetyltransferase
MSDVELREVAAGEPLADELSRALNAEGDRRYLDVRSFGRPAPLRDEHPPYDAVLVAYVGGAPAGLGALRRLDPATAEIKRMVVLDGHRGHGIGRLILEDLERRARDLGCSSVRLDSAARFTEALALYRSAGYREIPRYNDNPNAELWFEKDLELGA